MIRLFEICSPEEFEKVPGSTHYLRHTVGEQEAQTPN